jgi:DNA helicase-2/ATP-dependent DNA helicase PcrA
LLQEDPNQGRVLAVTFTRKAAGEMKERVERMLQELEELEDDSNNYSTESDDILRLDRYGDVIVREETYGRSTRNNEDVKPQPRELERVELGTFHSVCAKIMRYNGNLLIDLPSVRRDMSMAAPVEVSPQEAAADGKNLPALVDAQANLNAQFAIVDQAEQIRIVKECLKEQEIDLKTLDVKPIEIISGISDIREKFAQNEDPFEDKNTRKPGMGRKQRLARKIYYPYREKLLANNAVDFDDLIFMTRELLMDNPDLRQRLHCRWPHVLVDEFQDTSRTQMDLVKLLTSSSLFVVGDADQSIYSWRGAHVRSLHDVKTEFESYGEVSTVYLKENYRSTSNIVKAAEKVISAGQWKKPSVSIDEDDSVASLDSDEWSSDEVRRSMKPKRGAGPSPRVIACADERAEATFVVETILNMTSKEELKPDSTVAIIYRTNAQSRYLEEACVDKNLPYVIRGGAGGFYKRAEIKDSLCFLRWLFNGDDESSMLRAFKTPSKGIGDKAIEEFRAYVGKVQEYYRRSRPLNQRPTPLDILTSMASNQSSPDGFTLLVDGAPEPTEYISKRALTKFIEFGQKMGDIRTNALTMTVDKLLFYIIDELKLIEHFDSISKTKTEFADRQENVQELRQAAKKYATYGPALMSRNAASVKLTDDPFMDESESALGIFLDDVALVSDAAETESEGDGSKGRERMIVNLMTIHASKGTEFDAVFVVGLEEGTLPCSPSLQEGESQQLEEERRLCYVAMTRAKTNLVLTWRKEVTSFSSWSDSGPKTSRKKRSRFLDALVSNKSKLTGDDSKKTFKTKSGEKKEAIGTNDLLRPKGRDARNGVRQRQTREQVQLKSPHDFSTATKPPAAKRKQSSLSHSKQLSSPYYKSSQSKTGAVNGGKSKPSTTTSAAVASPKTLILSTSSSPKTAAASVPAEAAHHLLDPSWFFPVGQPVIHRQFGKGIVMGHPPCNDIDDATVSVQFMNGMTMEFPALGTDILPDM